jgi:hypothetical protein
MFISLTQQRYLDTGSTDDADGADGIFASCMHPDDPASGPAFANVWVRLGIAIGGLMLSVWQSQRGALLKVLAVDPATGNFTGAFISGPAGTCPGVPYDLAGRSRLSGRVPDVQELDVRLRATTVWSVSGVLPPSCGGRRSSEDANGVDRIGSHIWSTI